MDYMLRSNTLHTSQNVLQNKRKTTNAEIAPNPQFCNVALWQYLPPFHFGRHHLELRGRFVNFSPCTMQRFSSRVATQIMHPSKTTLLPIDESYFCRRILIRPPSEAPLLTPWKMQFRHCEANESASRSCPRLHEIVSAQRAGATF